MANDFSSDANCVALYNLESGALTVDSKGGNTLTDNNTVQEDTVNFKQGSCSADFEADNSESLSIIDADLDAGFPLKNGDTTKIISVCSWCRFESNPGSGSSRTIWSKYDSGGNKRSFIGGAYYDGSNLKFRIYLGYNNGSSAENHAHASVLSLATWYHVTFTYDNSDKSYAIRVRDTSGNVVGSDLTGTATLDASKLNVEDAPVGIGIFSPGIGNFWKHDGLIDELVVFKDIISSAETTTIAQGTYGAAGGVAPTGTIYGPLVGPMGGPI